MKKFFKSGKAKAVVIAGVIGTTAANAALTAPTIETTDFLTIAGAVLGATGVFFAIRKAMGLLR